MLAGRCDLIVGRQSWALEQRVAREREDGRDEQAPSYLAELDWASELCGAVADDAQQGASDDPAFVALLR